jgi:hypothetical protein
LVLLIVTIWSLKAQLTPAFFVSAHDDAIKINTIIQGNDFTGNEFIFIST